MSEQVAEITALTNQLATDNLALWSDEKRKSFTDTFDARIRVARYILIETAEQVAHKATQKHFVSEKHTKNISFRTPNDLLDAGQRSDWIHDSALIGKRPVLELNRIAAERADEIISNLPALNEAVRIISPEISLLIEKKSKLLAKGKAILEEADDLKGSLDMDDLDQAMTLAQFRQMVKDREKKRTALIAKLDEIGDEGRLLESKINKFLYDGLPGLSNAVVTVIREYLERADAFSGLNRRVAEQVHFGDSEAAMEMLKSFERDEVKVSSDIKAQFDKALEELKLAAKKGLSGSRGKKLTAGQRKD